MSNHADDLPVLVSPDVHLDEDFVLDHDMSWSESTEGVQRMKNELSQIDYIDLVDSGCFARLLQCGIYASEYVIDIKKSFLLENVRLVPTIVVSQQEMHSQNFSDFLAELEVFCEKIRPVEDINLELLVMHNDDSWWKKDNVENVERLFEHVNTATAKSKMFVDVFSPHVGEWNCVAIGPTRHDPEAKEHRLNGFSSLSDLVQFLLNDVIPEE